MRRSRSATPRSLLPLRRVAPERGYVRVRPVFAARLRVSCPYLSLASVQSSSWSLLVACPTYVSIRCPSDKLIVVYATNMNAILHYIDVSGGHSSVCVCVFSYTVLSADYHIAHTTPRAFFEYRKGWLCACAGGPRSPRTPHTSKRPQGQSSPTRGGGLARGRGGSRRPNQHTSHICVEMLVQ